MPSSRSSPSRSTRSNKGIAETSSYTSHLPPPRTIFTLHGLNRAPATLCDPNALEFFILHISTTTLDTTTHVPPRIYLPLLSPHLPRFPFPFFTPSEFFLVLIATSRGRTSLMGENPLPNPIFLSSVHIPPLTIPLQSGIVFGVDVFLHTASQVIFASTFRSHQKHICSDFFENADSVFE